MTTRFRIAPFLGISLLLAGPVSAQVECKVGDTWHPYSSKECQGKSDEFRQAPAPRASSSSSQRQKPATSGTNFRIFAWADERPAALARCQEKYDSHSMQHGCMLNEERGFKAMLNGYGMPESLQDQAQLRCIDKYPSWSMRHGCMLNESRSYKKLHGE